MKILILYRYTKNKSFNHFCNVDLYQYLNQLPNTTAKFYGVDVDQIYPDMCLTKYDSNLTMQNLHNRYDFDVLIVAGRNRTFFTSYEKESWLPKDFKTFNCFKILIEPDYHKYRKDNWVKDNNINLILHRHKNNVVRGNEDFPELTHIWFPFSVDTNLFKSLNNQRQNKICFVGNSKSKSYYYRKTASNILQNKNLIDFKGLQFEQDYINTLQEYTVYLNGSSNFNIDCAKAFEIIASGGIILTNDCYNGFDKLFPDCYITYQNDFSNLIKKANELLNNSALQKRLVKNGLKYILKNHTHLQRCKDLLTIINKSYLKQSEKIDVVYVIGNLTEDAWERFKYSYRSLCANKNYNVCVSEVGTESSINKLKEFISDFEYHYEYKELFDASVAKNNAFKYLIQSNIFTFMDIDMLMSNNFIEEIKDFYNKKHKCFLCSYGRLINDVHRYNEAISIFNKNDIKSTCDSGILVCDKKTYEYLNGFDEEYKGWGGRDSDFYKRLQMINNLAVNKNTILLHQYHPRNFGQNREYNQFRYRHRLNEYTHNRQLISSIKGLKNKKAQIIDPILVLQNNNINVCLLKNTCYEGIKKLNFTYPMHLGVDNLTKALEYINNPNIILENVSCNMKKVEYKGTTVNVPFPVVRYLKKLNYKDIQ